jgi:hypothetical protein
MDPDSLDGMSCCALTITRNDEEDDACGEAEPEVFEVVQTVVELEVKEPGSKGQVGISSSTGTTIYPVNVLLSTKCYNIKTVPQQNLICSCKRLRLTFILCLFESAFLFE